MNIQRMMHFVAVVEEASFTKAAARMGMKQPPLSQSISRLERDLGMTLLERSSRRVMPTKAGEAFLPEAKAAVAAVERAVALAQAASGARRPVRIGVVSVGLWEELPRLLLAAREASVPVVLEQMSTDDQLAALADGRLELGLVAPPFAPPPRMRVVQIAQEAAVLAIPGAWLRDRPRQVPLETLARQLIMFPRDRGPSLYDSVMAAFISRKLKPTVVQESPHTLTTLALVAAGWGASIVPASLSRAVAVKGVAFRPFDSAAAAPKWPVALAHMPLSARSDAARLLARWRRTAGEA